MTPSCCRRVWVLPLLAAAVLALAVGCGGGKKRAAVREARGPALLRHEFAMPGVGGDFRIVVFCPDIEATYLAEQAAFAKLLEMEQMFYESRTDSEVSQIHANAGLGAVRVSDDVY